MLSQKINQWLNILVFHALYLQCQTGGHCNRAGTEAFGSFCNNPVLPGSNLTIAGDDTDVENICISFILQTPKSLNTLNFCGRQYAPCKRSLYIIDRCSPLKNPGIGIAQRL